jgi:hypothetical protein
MMSRRWSDPQRAAPQEILKLDESCISNPKSEMSDWTVGAPGRREVQFKISDFGFELQDWSNFKISSPVSNARTCG